MSEEANINWREHDFKRMMMPKPPLEPAVDEVISRVVGKKIYQCDPRVIKLIVKWKAGKPPNSMEPDNFLADRHKIEELKTVLDQSL
jgi:hypothetical protein